MLALLPAALLHLPSSYIFQFPGQDIQEHFLGNFHDNQPGLL